MLKFDVVDMLVSQGDICDSSPEVKCVGPVARFLWYLFQDRPRVGKWTKRESARSP